MLSGPQFHHARSRVALRLQNNHPRGCWRLCERIRTLLRLYSNLLHFFRCGIWWLVLERVLIIYIFGGCFFTMGMWRVCRKILGQFLGVGFSEIEFLVRNHGFYSKNGVTWSKSRQ